MSATPNGPRLAEALSVPGPAPAADLAITAHTSEVRNASAWLEHAGAERGVPAEPLWRLELCLNEALANALTHGGESMRGGKVKLKLQVVRRTGNAEARVTVSDAGEAFDPLVIEPRRAPSTLADAKPGGLGVPLLRRFADELDYRRVDGRNQLTFGVRWEETL